MGNKYEVEETKYHAKIKVWDSTISKKAFWYHNEPYLADYTFDSKTIEEWAEIGINENNAEFLEEKYKKF